jgi:hypothetical protein
MILKMFSPLLDAYTAAEVNYTWKKKAGSNGIEIVSQEMAQFDLLGIKTETKHLLKQSECV